MIECGVWDERSWWSMCLARGGVGGEWGERTIELGLGFINSVGTGGVLDVCLCFGCGGVGGEWLGVWTRVSCFSNVMSII